MTYIEIEHKQSSGWFCHDDLILICDREVSLDDSQCPFMNDRTLQKLTRTTRRYIPKFDFNDEKLFPSSTRSNTERNVKEDIQSELNSMLACREYVRKPNHFFDRKEFQRTQATKEKKFDDLQINRSRRRTHVSRFDR